MDSGTPNSYNSVSNKNQTREYGQKPDPNLIYLKFVNQKEIATHIKVQRTSKITKAFDKYYQYHHLQYGTHRFLINGNRIQPSCPATVSDLDMQDGDQIDVVVEVEGGGRGA